MSQAHIVLAEPASDLKDALLEMVDDFFVAGERYSHYESAQHNFAAFLGSLENLAKGRNLPPGFVSMDTFWLLKDEKVILGESRLRHLLTPELQIEGGHIGYAIRPAARRQGYGTLILELTLEKARLLGLARVMVTCDYDNIGSTHIIEKNGGVFSGQAVSPRSGKQVKRYWITL